MFGDTRHGVLGYEVGARLAPDDAAPELGHAVGMVNVHDGEGRARLAPGVLALV